MTKIGTTMNLAAEECLIEFLKENKKVFAWNMTDLQGISPDVITHRLNVNPDAKPVKQKKRMFGAESSQAIKEKVEKLIKAKYVRPVQYPEWLANVVLVPKPNGKWRLCIDFTDLNKACPKDPFPLPRIDTLVDSTSGGDIPTTSQLHISRPIGRNMEVYIDDMLVKSIKEKDHIGDLQEYFEILKSFGLKLNPAKCTFGVRGGKFLGYIIFERGIEANPEKISAIMDMSPPHSIKDVQKLAGRLAALNRFISRSADKGLPFFKVLRGATKFEWTTASQEVFDDLRRYLTSPPLLTKPKAGELLYLYLAISESGVSSVLVRQEGKGHHPVYYVSKVLQGAEIRYSQIEKLALSLVIAARKLRPYFQSHQIVVLTNHPLKQVLANPELSGRMVK
ncbi:UNVERIFIED_CONTAM: Transposon Ty3-G Gag-Pol polyprotein [Sesamum latifolium]|uniref:Transposon Ty3-G Gag-Pol polyprotein n=1 Tax=Sesamum latifolium TaxID=2727402 RepID=A0AAW2WD47_9LAMI